jgi:hypothetical protein
MNNIANIGQIFMNFQAAIAGIRSECENLKTQVSSLKLEFNNLQSSYLSTNNEEKDVLHENFNKLTTYVEEISNSMSTKVQELSTQLVQVVQVQNNATSVDQLTFDLEQTKNTIASLSSRLHVVEQNEFLTKDDVKSLIDKSFSVLLEGLTFETHKIPTTSNGLLDLELPSILETTPSDKGLEDDEIDTPTESKEIFVESVSLDNPVIPKKGRGRGRKSTAL